MYIAKIIIYDADSDFFFKIIINQRQIM